MLGTNAVKDIQDPALEVGYDHVYPGQQFGCVLWIPLNHRRMEVAEFTQPAVGAPTVGRDDGTRGHAGEGGLAQAEAVYPLHLYPLHHLHVGPGEPTLWLSLIH